jgi:SAM-dependent methyltransferase
MMVGGRSIFRAVTRDSRLSRWVRRPLWVGFYGLAGRRMQSAPTAFMNWGYLSDESDLPGADDEIVEFVSKGLYDAVLDDVELAGRAVIEVGCGAGAGSAHMAATRKPASLTGIDLSKGLVAWCDGHWRGDGLQFVHGDALDLPVASASVDVVVNVESSHCYRSRATFFEEVRRVLRPGGTFLLADIVSCEAGAEGVEEVSALLRRAGLTVEACVDIAANVLAARDAVSRSQSARSSFEAVRSATGVRLAEEAFCLPGTKMYEDLARGRLCYFRWKAAKPNINHSAAAEGRKPPSDGLAPASAQET